MLNSLRTSAAATQNDPAGAVTARSIVPVARRRRAITSSAGGGEGGCCGGGGGGQTPSTSSSLRPSVFSAPSSSGGGGGCGCSGGSAAAAAPSSASSAAAAPFSASFAGEVSVSRADLELAAAATAKPGIRRKEEETIASSPDSPPRERFIDVAAILRGELQEDEVEDPEAYLDKIV